MGKKRVFIIGGGAAGMMSGIIAARNGGAVTIFEHNDRLGKKLLATGNGKCNYTNLYQSLNNYRADSEGFIAEVLNQFDYKNTISFFEELGIISKDRNGYVYPYSGQAASVLDALKLELRKLKVDIITDIHIDRVERSNSFFRIYSKDRFFECDSLIIAAGSKAGKNLGADGSGYSIAKNLGHGIKTVLPALVQLKSPQKDFKLVAGVRCDGRIDLKVDGEIVATDTGEIQLTDYGISGIPVFQVSRYASIALNNKRQVEAVIDFMPELSIDDLKKSLTARFSDDGKNAEEALNGLLNKKINYMLIKKTGIEAEAKCRTVSPKQLNKFAENVKAFSVMISETNSFENAQICTGGVEINQMNANSLESVLNKGLFFAGEIIDVDGICGGYNLQWAWSSGYVAGLNAAK